MSLSWRRLLRFLRAEEVPLTEKGDGSGTSAPLLPLNAAFDESTFSAAGRLATAALRATHADGTTVLRAFAQPRGAVEFLIQVPRPRRAVISAHDSVAAAVAVVGSHVLTLGVDSSYSALKVWRTGSEGEPTCISTLRFSPDDTPTALAVRSRGDSTLLTAVGFADGAVVLLRGDVIRERVNRKRIAPSPGEMSENRPVVALRFLDDDTLFLATEASVAAIHCADDHRTVLDTRGAARGAHCTLLHHSQQFCVAREEALYFFTHVGRGPCLAFATAVPEGYVCAYGKYLVHGGGDGEVVAYDITNKVLAYKGKGDVCAVFEDADGTALLCMKDGTVRRLTEVPLRKRVNMLLDRELYVPAVALARTETRTNEMNRELLTSAVRRYAEHLIEKNDYDGAAAQLVDIINGPAVEPSWVITRLVEQPGLRSGLRMYLEALHAAGKAAFVHTKVLITCYRHDRERAAVLPKCTPDETATTNDDHVCNVFANVDWTTEQVDSAIGMCRNAGLYRVAESLARGKKRNVALAQVLVHDLDEKAAALALLNSIEGEAEVSAVLDAVARSLLVQISAPFVDFLANAICKSSVRAAQNMKQPVIQLKDYAHLFADRPRWYAVLLERVLARPGGLPAQTVPGTWLELFESLVCVDIAERVAASGTYASSNAGISMDAQSMDMDDMRSSLSSLPSTVFGAQRNRTPRVGRRALKILQSRRSMIDPRKALRIAEVHGHDSCLEYLYEYLRMYRELGVCLRQNENEKALLRAARRHGEREPQLWLEALRYFAPRACDELVLREDRFGRHASDDEDGGLRSRSHSPAMRMRGTPAIDGLNEVMTALSRSAVVTTLEIVDIVTDACPDAPLALVGEFIEKSVAAMNRRAVQEEYNGVRLAVELGELRKEAQRLGEEAVVMRPQPCAACDEPAAVPMMHFFCGHSYHAACLAPIGGSPMRSRDSYGDGLWVEECPKCAPEQDAAVSMRNAIEERNMKHDDFFSRLKSSRDPFATVLEYLERRAFV